ncbi:MAG: undecaprenyldiphospho-muramoylpentapeptide beta-N-acetylglucosaminyltransferase [Candidatus Omnitrophota bacterium]
MKILIASSGSGGHVFPALALAEELKVKKRSEVIFLQTNRKETDKLIKDKGFNLVASNLDKISFHSFKNGFISTFKLLAAAIHSLKIILRIKPSVVVGFGGYHSGPIIVVAHFLGIPTIVHEQNVLPGKANYILSRFVDKIAVSFKESEDYFNSKKVVFTGCPLRSEVTGVSKEESRKKYNFDEDKFTILVMGGSQGSQSINSNFLNAVPMIKEKNKIQIIHITGIKDYEFISKEYSKMNISPLVFAFLEEIGYAYRLADIIISRSGASTVSEIIALGIPAIIIPYPFVRKHQSLNAKILSDAGSAILIEDEELSAEILKEKISLLMSEKDRILRMKQALNKLQIPNAAENLEREVLSLI